MLDAGRASASQANSASVSAYHDLAAMSSTALSACDAEREE
jgi:hypothetical protein